MNDLRMQRTIQWCQPPYILSNASLKIEPSSVARACFVINVKWANTGISIFIDSRKSELSRLSLNRRLDGGPDSRLFDN